LNEFKAFCDVTLRLHKILLDEYRTDELIDVRIIIELLKLLTTSRRRFTG
tara:strand:+ start:7044 stop:7193 length:150 start_codon:yes stop_codon:yes gene_type:complete